MPRPELLPDLEGPPDGVEDLVPLHLVHQLHRHLRRQLHLAGHHVDVDDGELPPPLRERGQRLRRHQPATEEELHGAGVERHAHLLVGVGDVGDEDHVAVEVGRGGADVDAVERGVGNVEGGRPGLHRQEDDEDDEAGEDEEDAEDEADDGGAPHRRRGRVPRLEDELGLLRLRQRRRLLLHADDLGDDGSWRLEVVRSTHRFRPPALAAAAIYHQLAGEEKREEERV